MNFSDASSVCVNWRTDLQFLACWYVKRRNSKSAEPKFKGLGITGISSIQFNLSLCDKLVF